MWIVRLTAAASIIGLLFLGAYVGLNKGKKNDIAATEAKRKSNNKDILPGRDKAVLTLADGSTINLDDAHNGVLTKQGQTKVLKVNGKLAYNSTESGIKEVLYNTLSTPRGGQYQIELPDGSKVWLNAASSLRFPTVFTGKERRVAITGEAYFEVTKNKDMPFIVSVNDAEVEVLGTHFNVMAYNDEDVVKTTLLEGAVKFTEGNNKSVLHPGQQSLLAKNGQLKVISGVNVDEVMAWKNGTFHFEGADIGTVTRQLSRWYDVDIIYKQKIDDLFYAEIPRNTKLSDALKALELTGKVRFKMEGKKIIVMS